MPSRFSTIAPVAGLVAAALGLSACDITIGASEYSVREQKTFTVNGPVRLALSTFDGSIKVRGWDRDEVAVEVEKVGPDQQTVDRIQVKTAQDGNAITVEVPKPSPLETSGMRRSPGANLVVTVPVKTAVVARSGDGSIEVRSVNGNVDLNTDDGSVQVEEIGGDLVARTGDGSVHGRKVDGRAEIRTGDGSVGLDGVLTGVTIETRDGSIEVTARPGSRTGTDWDVTTGDGNVQLEVPKDFGAEIDARSGDGRVRVDTLTDTPEGRSREDDERSSVTGRLGGGGKLLRVRSSSGSITVKLW
jgi:DUF4097 and DUF4098 domain-containing protein YvlB